MKKLIAPVLVMVLVAGFIMPLSAFAGTSFSSASSITMDTNVTCSITTADTTQYYKFTPTASGTYTFNSTGDYDTYGYLYSASQSELAHNDDSNGRNFSISYNLTAGATYYFGARMYSSSQTGNFTIRITSPFSNAESLTLNTNKSCNIAVGGAVQYYRFVPNTTGEYVFYSSGSYDTYVYLYDSAKRTLSSQDNGGSGYNFSIKSNLSSGNTYYYGVKMRSGSATGSFSVRIERVSTTDNTAPTVRLSATNYTDSAQNVTISLSDNIAVAGYYWGTGSSYASNTYTGISQSSSASVTKTITAPGTYYATAKDSSGTVSSTVSITFYKTMLNANGGSVSPGYILTAKGNSITLPIPKKSGFIYEGWSTDSAATSGTKSITPSTNTTYYAVWGVESISAGREKTVNIASGGDLKYFKFVPATTGIYKFYSTGSFDTYGVIYDSKMKELGKSDDISGSDKNFSVTYTMTAGTTYYLCAKMYYDSTTGSFTAGLATVPDTTAPTVSVSSTSEAATSQSATIKLSDNVGIAGYYWGTNSSYAKNAYTATSAKSATKKVTAAGTYYVTAKDTAGNVSSTVAVTFYKTSLNANGGKVSPTYVITKSGDKFTLKATKSGYDFVGWSTSASAKSGSPTVTVSANRTYYAVWSSSHKYKTVTQKATTSRDGYRKEVCEYCGKVKSSKTYYQVKSVTLSATKYTYNGKTKTPTVTVKDKKGNKLSTSCYTVTYPKSRKAVGTYTVKVAFKGNYSGSLTRTFDIIPPGTQITSIKAQKAQLRLNWKKVSGVTGYQIQSAFNKEFTKSAKTYTIKTANTTSYVLPLNYKDKPYVRIRTYKKVGSKNYYSSWKTYQIKK